MLESEIKRIENASTTTSNDIGLLQRPKATGSFQGMSSSGDGRLQSHMTANSKPEPSLRHSHKDWRAPSAVNTIIGGTTRPNLSSKVSNDYASSSRTTSTRNTSPQLAIRNLDSNVNVTPVKSSHFQTEAYHASPSNAYTYSSPSATSPHPFQRSNPQGEVSLNNPRPSSSSGANSATIRSVSARQLLAPQPGASFTLSTVGASHRHPSK